jgi:glucokinase
MRELRIAGVDLGGTNVRCGLVRVPATAPGPDPVAGSGRPVCESAARRRLGTRALDAVLEIVCEELARLDGPLDAVGIAVAGMVDASHRSVLRAPNLDWTDVPLARILEDRLGIPVAVLNDVNAITWGEFLCLGRPEVAHLMAVFFGTGVGGGLVIDRRLVEGARGLAMEIGHVPVDGSPGAPPCGCGRRGCLEAYVGGQNFAAWIATRTLPFPAPAHLGELDSLAAAGDPEADRLVERLAGYVAGVLGGAITLLDPGHLLVGGTVWDGCPGFSRRVRERVNDRLPGAVTWLAPVLGIEAGILGAAGVARGLVAHPRKPGGS